MIDEDPLEPKSATSDASISQVNPSGALNKIKVKSRSIVVKLCVSKRSKKSTIHDSR